MEVREYVGDRGGVVGERCSEGMRDCEGRIFKQVATGG